MTADRRVVVSTAVAVTLGVVIPYGSLMLSRSLENLFWTIGSIVLTYLVSGFVAPAIAGVSIAASGSERRLGGLIVLVVLQPVAIVLGLAAAGAEFTEPGGVLLVVFLVAVGALSGYGIGRIF